MVAVRGAMVALRIGMVALGGKDTLTGSRMTTEVTANVPLMVPLYVPFLPDMAVPFLADGVRVLFRLALGETAVPLAVRPTAGLPPIALVFLDEVVVLYNVLLPTAGLE